MIKQIPSKMNLSETGYVKFADQEGGPLENENSLTRDISIDLYSGAEVQDAFEGSMIVDLSKMEMPKERMPILLNHDSGSIVGFADPKKIANTGETLSLQGEAIKAMTATQEVINASEGGFPFQASMGFDIMEARFIEKGEREEINGRDFQGPGIIIDKSRLFEASIVPLGRDENTSSKVMSNENENIKKVEVKMANSDNRDPVEAFEADHKDTVSKWKNEGIDTGMKDGLTAGDKKAREQFKALNDAYPEDAEFVCTQFANGVTVEDSAVAFNTVLHERLKEKDETIEEMKKSTKGKGSDGVENFNRDGDGSLSDDVMTPEELAKKHWAKNHEKCRTEFTSEVSLAACIKQERFMATRKV